MALAGGDYEIRIKGRLSDSLLAAFEGLTTTVQPVETVLYGPVQDQAALNRLLDRIQSLGLELVEIRQLPASADEVAPNPSTNRQIRRLVLYVHPVRLSAVCAPMGSGLVKGVKGSARWWDLIGWRVMLVVGGIVGREGPDDVAELARMHPFGPEGGSA
jgi:hypothetical protein